MNIFKNIKNTYNGVIVPMITPFTSSLQVDVAAAKSISNHLVENDCAVFVLGTTGEAMSVSHEQKLLLVDTVVKTVAKRKTVYAGISGNCFRETLNNAIRYADLGVDVLVAHLPVFYPLTDKHILNYFEQLADAVPLPLIIYNIPATTHHSISLELIHKLSKHKNIIGLKDSERGDERLDESIGLWKDRKDFVFHLGWAAKSSYGLQKGLDGIIPSTGNLFPKLYRDMVQSVKDGQFEKADQLQELTNTIGNYYQAGVLLSEALPKLKVMMRAFGLCEDHVPLPLIKIPESQYEQLKNEVIKNFGQYNTYRS